MHWWEDANSAASRVQYNEYICLDPWLTHRCLWHEDRMQTGFRLEVHLVRMIQYGLETVPVLNWKQQENMDESVSPYRFIFVKAWNNLLPFWWHLGKCKWKVQNICTPCTVLKKHAVYAQQSAAFSHCHDDMDSIFVLSTTITGPDGRENRAKRSFYRW